jgi:CheY-like chemotaxis protein
MNKSILLVDDESEIRSLLKLAIQSGGYNVFEAATGAEARRIAAEHPPDLIICDLHLDDVDGLDLIQELSQRYQGVPTVLLTATLFDPAAVDEVILKRVSVYIQKSAPLRHIISEIRRLLDHGEHK